MGVRWQVATLLVAMASTSLLGGCVVVTNNTAQTYETCNSGESCTGGICEQANTTTDGFVGDFCTASCDPNANPPSCPNSPNGGLPVCVPDATGLTGQCYAGCTVSADCPFGETCAAEASGPSFCVP